LELKIKLMMMETAIIMYLEMKPMLNSKTGKDLPLKIQKIYLIVIKH